MCGLHRAELSESASSRWDWGAHLGSGQSGEVCSTFAEARRCQSHAKARKGQLKLQSLIDSSTHLVFGVWIVSARYVFL